MDGTMFGKLLVDIVLAYFVGRFTWNKTQSSGKTTIVVIIALVSPLIAWIVSYFFSPAEQSGFTLSIKNNDETEGNTGEALETDNTTVEEKTKGKETNKSEKRQYVFSFDNNSNKPIDNPITTNKDELHNETDSKTIKNKYEPVMIKGDKSKDKQKLDLKRFNIEEEKKTIEFCRFCGAKLNYDAEFCHKCGKKVG